MPLYARRMVDVWGGINWVLQDQGIAHPLVVIPDIEMEKFIEDVQRQREQHAVNKARQWPKWELYRCRYCSSEFDKPSKRMRHEIDVHLTPFKKEDRKII